MATAMDVTQDLDLKDDIHLHALCELTSPVLFRFSLLSLSLSFVAPGFGVHVHVRMILRCCYVVS